MKTTEAGFSCKPQGTDPHSLQRHIIRSLSQAIYHPALHLYLRIPGRRPSELYMPGTSPWASPADSGSTGLYQCSALSQRSGCRHLAPTRARGLPRGRAHLCTHGVCHCRRAMAYAMDQTTSLGRQAGMQAWGPPRERALRVGKGESVGSRRAAETHPQP